MPAPGHLQSRKKPTAFDSRFKAVHPYALCFCLGKSLWEFASQWGACLLENLQGILAEVGFVALVGLALELPPFDELTTTQTWLKRQQKCHCAMAEPAGLLVSQGFTGGLCGFRHLMFCSRCGWTHNKPKCRLPALQRNKLAC